MAGLSTHSLHPGNTVADKKRAAVFHPRVTYSFQNYLAYPLYPMLYIARAIITFNDSMLQVGEGHLILCRYAWCWWRFSLFYIKLTHPKVITPLETVLYVLHFLISLLTMEIVIYVKHART
jgi:hypothetical protein